MYLVIQNVDRAMTARIYVEINLMGTDLNKIILLNSEAIYFLTVYVANIVNKTQLWWFDCLSVVM